MDLLEKSRKKPYYKACTEPSEKANQSRNGWLYNFRNVKPSYGAENYGICHHKQKYIQNNY